jgi:hypothetical protein
MSAFQERFFEHDPELEDYEDNEILGNDSELDLELDELDVMPQEFEAEGEIGQRSRLPFRPSPRSLRPRPQSAARRQPAYRPKPRRVIRRHPRSVFPHEPVTCICPEKTCPEHGTEYIRWVQSALNDVLGLRLPVNGIMGLETRSAVRSFQQREGLPVTGIVGPDIESALIAARGGKSPGAGATKPAEPDMMEPVEPAATPPEPDSAKPAAEFDFEWEVAPLGQRETQRPAARYRMVDPAKVSCAKLNRSLPIFKAIGTKDPIGVLEAVSQRAVAMIDNTIAEMNRIRERVRAGEPLAWPLIDDLLAWSLKTRMLMRINDPKAWTGKGTAKDRRTAGLIIRWLSNIRKIIAGGHLWYTCLASSHCGPSTWAWVFCWFVPRNFLKKLKLRLLS